MIPSAQSIVHILDLFSQVLTLGKTVWWPHHLCSQVFHLLTQEGLVPKAVFIYTWVIRSARWRTTWMCPLAKWHKPSWTTIHIWSFQQFWMWNHETFLVSSSKAQVVFKCSVLSHSLWKLFVEGYNLFLRIWSPVLNIDLYKSISIRLLLLPHFSPTYGYISYKLCLYILYPVKDSRLNWNAGALISSFNTGKNLVILGNKNKK